MTGEQWRRIEQLCSAALDKQGEERDRWLHEACGTDRELYEEVKSLLTYRERAENFLAVPAVEATAAGLAKNGARLAPGAVLGHFHIQSLIGSGGMGDVYRARDTRLRRDVAIKVLPELLTTDAERVSRFEREAHVLASLNHPHIAAIYGVEPATAERSGYATRAAVGTVLGLVMELVEGPTLAERIADGPLALDEALPLARQIADALEAAHARGVVHRDLKPANIKLTGDGTVKVLDFGLAKVFGNDTRAGDPQPALLPATRAGVILGTTAYMSPQQARGRPVDQRADVWAFGCILYEMLTGKRAFAGEDTSQVLAAVLRQEVEWAALPPSTPERVRWLLQRCLERDPKQRLRDMGDAHLLLSGDFSVTSNKTAHKSRAWRIAIGLTALALITAALGAWMTDVIGTRGASAVRILDVSDTTNALHPAISPDGHMVAYATPEGLWVRRFDKETPSRIVTGPNIGSLTWAPGSDALAYFRGVNVHVVRVDGTEDHTVWRPTPDIRTSRVDMGLVWSGSSLYLPVLVPPGTPGTSAVARVPLDGGEPTVTRPSNSTPSMAIFRHPILLDDGPTLLVNPGIREKDRVNFGTVWALRGTEAKQVLALPEMNVSGMAYLPATRVLLVAAGDGKQSRALWAAPFDVERLTAGQPRPIVDGAYPSSPSADGDIVLMTGGRPRLPILRRFDAAGRELASAPLHRMDIRNLEVAPNGQRLVYRALTAMGARSELWMYHTALGLETFAGTVQGSGLTAWSPDSRRVAVAQLGGSDGALDLVDVDGGPTRRLVSSGVRGRPSWAPNGRQVLFPSGEPNALEIASVSTDGTGEARPQTVARIPGLLRFALSPNGRFLAYHSGPRERAVVTVTPFPALSPRIQVSGEGVEYLQWSSKSDEVWLVQKNEILGVPIVTDRNEGLTSGAPRSVFKPPAGLTLLHSMRGKQFATVDGKEFWMLDQRPEGAPRVTLIENVERLIRVPGK